jgi:RNA polymerase sigma-70 factor (ECF subfamily)
MHNLNVNEVRRLVKEETLVDIEECSSKLIATTDPTASRQLQELDRAIAQLPEDQRQVLLLVGLEGMDYEGAATVLNIPVGTVRSRLSRGRDLLRKLMGVEKSPNQVGRPKRSVTSSPAMAA